MKIAGWIYAVVAGTCFWCVVGRLPPNKLLGAGHGKRDDVAAPKYPSLPFTTENETLEYYYDFIEELRDLLASGDEAHGMRITREPSSVSDDKRFVLVELSNDARQQVTLAIDVVNAYVVAYRVGDMAFFFKNSSKAALRNLFTDAAMVTLPFDGSYGQLERVAGRGRQDINLVRRSLDRAIKHLSRTGKHQNNAPEANALLVCIQMISEAARFNYIKQRVGDNINGDRFQPDNYMLWLENKWGHVSSTVQYSNEIEIFLDAMRDQDKRGKRGEMLEVTRALICNVGLLLFVRDKKSQRSKKSKHSLKHSNKVMDMDNEPRAIRLQCAKKSKHSPKSSTKASKDAKKLVDKERSFARAENKSSRAAVQRVEESLQEHERMSQASGKQVMDMDNEQRAIRLQCAKKSKHSPKSSTELSRSRRCQQSMPQLYKLEGSKALGSNLRISPCSNEAPDLSKCAIQWYRVSVKSGKKQLLSGATESVYAPEPSDVGRILQAEIDCEGQQFIVPTTGAIDLAAGLSRYVKDLLLESDLKFNVVVTQMNGADYTKESIHVFHVGKMGIKLCKGKTTVAREYYSSSTQLCGFRGGGDDAAQALFWPAKKGLSFVISFESAKKRNAAIMLARQFANVITLARPDDRAP